MSKTQNTKQNNDLNEMYNKSKQTVFNNIDIKSKKYKSEYKEYATKSDNNNVYKPCNDNSIEDVQFIKSQTIGEDKSIKYDRAPLIKGKAGKCAYTLPACLCEVFALKGDKSKYIVKLTFNTDSIVTNWLNWFEDWCGSRLIAKYKQIKKSKKAEGLERCRTTYGSYFTTPIASLSKKKNKVTGNEDIDGTKTVLFCEYHHKFFDKKMNIYKRTSAGLVHMNKKAKDDKSMCLYKFVGIPFIHFYDIFNGKTSTKIRYFIDNFIVLTKKTKEVKRTPSISSDVYDSANIADRFGMDNDEDEEVDSDDEDSDNEEEEAKPVDKLKQIEDSDSDSDYGEALGFPTVEGENIYV